MPAFWSVCWSMVSPSVPMLHGPCGNCGSVILWQSSSMTNWQRCLIASEFSNYRMDVDDEGLQPTIDKIWKKKHGKFASFVASQIPLWGGFVSPLALDVSSTTCTVLICLLALWIRSLTPSCPIQTPNLFTGLPYTNIISFFTILSNSNSFCCPKKSVRHTSADV